MESKGAYELGMAGNGMVDNRIFQGLERRLSGPRARSRSLTAKRGGTHRPLVILLGHEWEEKGRSMLNDVRV
jgi:hypothetical protein